MPSYRRGCRPAKNPARRAAAPPRCAPYLPGEMIGARIKHPNIPACSAHAENLRPRGMLAHPGKPRPDSDARHRFELYEIHDGNIAVRRCNVSAEMQVRPQERRPMLAQKHDEASEAQRGEQEVRAEVLRAIHLRNEIVTCNEETSKAAR